MTNEDLAREAASMICATVPPHGETARWAKWGRSCYDRVLQAISASQVDVKGLVEAADELNSCVCNFLAFDTPGNRKKVALVAETYCNLRDALSAHPTSEAQCEAGMEKFGFHRVLPADVAKLLLGLHWQLSQEDISCQAKKHYCDEIDALLKKYTSAPSLPAEAITLAYAIIEDAENGRFEYRTHETMMAGTKSYPLAKAVLKKYIPEEQGNETI